MQCNSAVYSSMNFVKYYYSYIVLHAVRVLRGTKAIYRLSHLSFNIKINFSSSKDWDNV